MSSALIGALRVVLGMDSAAFEEGLSAAEKQLNAFGKRMDRLGGQLTKWGAGLTAGLTAPLGLFGKSVLSTSGDFEAAMNRVGAALGAPADKMSELEKLARELGSSTSKSASESADMLEMLAKNGLDAEQILGGAATAAIKLSEATGGDLSRSADVATNAMAQFEIAAKDMGDTVDQITSVTLASQFGFDDYALALGQAGGVAGALGVKFSDFNAAIAATSDVFNSGSDAGTSFKQFLVSLNPKSKKAAELIEQYGLKFYEANGQMKGMAAIAEELKSKLGGLSDEQLSGVMTDLFGTDAMRTAIALMKQGGVGIDEMSKKIAAKGVADEQAAARMKGFNGEMERLSGAFDELKIAIGKSGLLNLMTQLVAKLGVWIEALAQTSPEMLKWGTIAAGVAAAVGPLLMILGGMASGVSALIAALPALGVVLGALLSPIGLVVAAFAAIAAVWVYWDELKVAFPGIAAAVQTGAAAINIAIQGVVNILKLMGQGVVQLVTGDWAGAWETAKAIFQTFVTTVAGIFQTLFPQTFATLKELVNSTITTFADLKTRAVAYVTQMAADIVAAIQALPGQMMEIGQQIIDGLINGIKAKWEAGKAYIASIPGEIAASFRSALGIHSPSRVMAEIGQFIMQGLGLGMENNVQPVLAQAGAVAGQVSGQFDQVGKSMEGVFSGFGSSVAEVIKGTKSLTDVLSDLLGKLADLAIQGFATNLFGGGGGGGLGGFFQSLLGGLVGFAQGGTIMPGGAGGIDSQIVAFRKSPNERVDITKPGQTLGGGSYAPVYNIDARGADQSAIDRLQRGLEERDRSFSSRVDARVDQRQSRRTRA